ncbi:MAG: hypothetical protein GF364_21145 [Candidatus Lokiarchaeota archaeon]|nr:hypothetical protein [Candidatus Lokiarchaeota archaeon]
MCYDNSSLYIFNNTKIPNQLGIQFYGNSEVIIDNSFVELVNILEGAKLMISNSDISQIIVNAYRLEEYSVKINKSTIDTLITYSWSFIHIDLISIISRH